MPSTNRISQNVAEESDADGAGASPVLMLSAIKGCPKNDSSPKSNSLRVDPSDSFSVSRPGKSIKEVAFPKVSTAVSQARLKSPMLDLPHRTPTSISFHAQEHAQESGPNEDAGTRDQIIRLISLPSAVQKSSAPLASRSLIGLDEPATQFPAKRSNVVLAPKHFSRQHVSSECVLLHSFVYSSQEDMELTGSSSYLGLASNHDAQGKCNQRGRNSLDASAAGVQQFTIPSQGRVSENASSQNSRLIVTEKNSSSSVFVKKLMTHISTKIAASNDVSMMSQQSVIFVDEDGRTEGLSMSAFSHAAAGLQLALIAKLNSSFQQRKYFLWMKEHTAMAKFRKNRQLLEGRMKLILNEDRIGLRNEINREFGAVLMTLCHESKLALTCSSSNESWSIESLQEYFSALTEDCKSAMLSACLNTSDLLKMRFDIKNRSLTDRKKRIFSHLLLLRKENEAHEIAAADLHELAVGLSDAIRYMIAWVHKILINVLQSMSKHFSSRHVDVKSSLALMCSWSIDNQIILSPDIISITRILQNGIKSAHEIAWSIFTANCCSFLVFETFHNVAPQLLSQMREIKKFNSEFTSNWFLSTSSSKFIEKFTSSYECICDVVKGDALSAVNQAKVIELEIVANMKSTPVDRFATVCKQYYGAVQLSLRRLDSVPSNFHETFFCLNTKSEFMVAKTHLEKEWELQFAQSKQRFKLLVENLSNRIHKIASSLRSIDLSVKKDDDLIQSSTQLHENILRAQDALPHMQSEKKNLMMVCEAIISCSSPGVPVQYWEDFEKTVHFRTIIEEIAIAKRTMMRSHDRLISLFDSGQDELSTKLRNLNQQLEEIDIIEDFSAKSILDTRDKVNNISEVASQIFTLVSALLENHTTLCSDSVAKSKGKHSEVKLRRTPQDIFFVATIVTENSQSCLNNWNLIFLKSKKLEQAFGVTYAEASNNFLAFEANFKSIECDSDYSIDIDLFQRFLLFHSERILRLKSLYPFLKISIPQIKEEAFKNVMNIILPASYSHFDQSVTFGEILDIWETVSEEQTSLIREWIKHQTDVAEKVNQAQSTVESATSRFMWKDFSVFQEVRFPQYSGHCSAFVNPNINDLLCACEDHIDGIVNILSTLEKELNETRLALSQFLEDFYITRSFLQAVFACSYWTCCMLTITFERKGDEDQTEFLTWGGHPDHLKARNAAVQAYKVCMTSLFQQCKIYAEESMFEHLRYISQAVLHLSEVTGQMRAVYDNYRDSTFFPMSLSWFPSIILLEEDLQDAAILSLGPADSSKACRCFSSLMDAAKLKLFVNVSRITNDKEFGQPAMLTTHCGRSIGFESSLHLFGRSIHLSLLLKARSIKNAFKKCYLQTINKFQQHDNSSFCQLLSLTQLKEHLLEGIILAILVKLSSVDKNDRNCRLVQDMLESINQVATDSANGNIQAATALASLIILRDACCSVALRTICCWKFNFEEQSVRIEVGSSISVSHNLEVSANMNWLFFLTCDDSYLIKCLQAVAFSPSVLEEQWDDKTHATFAHDLAALTGRQLSARIASSSQVRFWIQAISESKGFGIIISDEDSSKKVPIEQFTANVLKIGSVFWWASKSPNALASGIPSVLLTSSMKPFLNFSDYESSNMQLDCIYRTFRIIPPRIIVARTLQEVPSEYGNLMETFCKLNCHIIPSFQGKKVILSKQFLISRAKQSIKSCFETTANVSFSNLDALFSSCTTKIRSFETIKTWIQDRQKMVISGRSSSGKSTIIANALKEFIQSGSIVQKFFWEGIVPMSSSISPDELKTVQLEVLRNFYENKHVSTMAIAWIDCPDFSDFPSNQVAELKLLPLIIETQCITHSDPASLCAYNHYCVDGDEVCRPSDIVAERITKEANECLVRKTSAQRFILIRRVHQFFMESLKFVQEHCTLSHNLQFSEIHFVENFSILMKSCCVQMKKSRCSTFGPSWWKKYNLCSETAFYHMSVFCTIWSIGGCLSQKHQDNYDVWVRTLGFEIMNVPSLVDLKVTSIFNCILATSVASNGLRLQQFQDYELLERFAALGDLGLFCPSPKHYMCREIIRFLSESGKIVAFLGPLESGKSLFLKSVCKNLESTATQPGCTFVSFVKPSSHFRNTKALAGSFRDSSKVLGSCNIIIDDFHMGFGISNTSHHANLEVSQVYGVIRSFLCSRTICLVDRVNQNRRHSISIFREPILTSTNMILGVSTSAPQYASPLLHNILSSSFLLQPDSITEQTFQVICSRSVDLKLRQCNRNSTPIVEFSLPIMSSVLYRAHDLLVMNMRRMLLPQHYDIPTHSYFASALLRLVDTYGCTQKNNNLATDRKEKRTFDFLAYVRAATSGVQKAKQAVANSVQDEYYLDPSSVWKAFAIHFRDLISHFLSSHVMFEIERMMEESYFAEINKLISSAMNSVGCEHGGQLDAILSPIAKYILAAEPDPNASFILKSLPGDVSLQSYEEMWQKYIYDGQEFRFKFMLGLMQSEQNISKSLSQIAGAFHQLTLFLKFQDPLLRIRCFDGADFLNLVELCESLKVFRYFSVRYIDILDDPNMTLRSEILDCLQEDHCVLFAINLQCNTYLSKSHVSAANLHHALIAHVELLHAIVIERKPTYLFDANEILAIANRIQSTNEKQKLLSLEAATDILASELLSRFKFVIAVDANPILPTSMHQEYYAYRKLRLKASVCSLFATSIPRTFGLIRLYRQHQSYELACKNWKQAGLNVAGIPMASFKMEITGYLLLTASILDQLSMNSNFENPHVLKFLVRNLELCNVVCVKFMFHVSLFREQFGFCIEQLQRSLRGINMVIRINAAASIECKRLSAELLEKRALLESLQAKYKVERSVFRQALKTTDQVAQSRPMTSIVGNAQIRVSSLFSSSSYGSSILETSRCVNEIQKLSDVDISNVSKAISEPKNVEERLISELVVTIFQFTQLGLTPAAFSTSPADFKYRIASLSVLQLPLSSLELIMRFIRNPLLQLSDNPFYTHRSGLKLLMEWIQSIACQIYSRKKNEEATACEDFDADGWIASILKRHSFLDDAANALKDKNASSIEVLKCRIQELQSELDPFEAILRCIKSMEPTLREIKAKAKTYLRKLFILESLCEEISFCYSLISIVCLPFCRENQDRFFEIIKELTSDASLTAPGTVLHTIYSRYFVTVSKDNQLSFQFLHSMDLKSFISLCVTIIYAKDTQFLFHQDLHVFSDSQTADNTFTALATATTSSAKLVLLMNDPFENEVRLPSIRADASASDLENLVARNEVAFSNVVSCSSELARFCDNFDQMIRQSSRNECSKRVTLVSQTSDVSHHDPFYSMESTQKIKEYGSQLSVIDNEGVSSVSASFRLVLPINPYSVLKSIPLEGIPLTGFQMINCVDFEKSFANAFVGCLMSSADAKLYQNLCNIRKSMSEFTRQKVSSLNAICSDLCNICDHVGGFDDNWSAATPDKCAEILARSVQCSKSYRKIVPLLDACIEALGPCLHFESNWLEVSRLIISSVVWLLSTARGIPSLRSVNWISTVPKSLMLSLKKFPLQIDPTTAQSYRGNEPWKLAKQISGDVGEHLRYCMSDVALEYSIHFDAVIHLIEKMTMGTQIFTLVEMCPYSTNLPFLSSIVHASYFYKLQLPMGLREFEASQNARLQMHRSFWSVKNVVHEFIESHPEIDLDMSAQHDIGNAPLEIRTIFVLLHILTYNETQMEDHDAENPMIINVEMKKSAMPECITDKRLYVLRFLNIILADQFDLFIENLRTMNSRPAFVEDFGRIHIESFFSLLKREPFSENDKLVSLFRKIFEPCSDSPFGALLTAFLLGSTAFLSFFTSNSFLKHKHASFNIKASQFRGSSMDDLWNENSNLNPRCSSLISATDVFR
jgi:hypothetical protein